MAKDYSYEPEETQSRALVKSGGSNVVAFEKEQGTEAVALRDSTFGGLGIQRVSKAQEKILCSPPDPFRDVHILPTGEVYAPQIAYRRRLNKAFGPMGWALRPISGTTPPAEKATMYREYVLIAEGRAIGAAHGSGKYYDTNARMDYADTAEAIRSDAMKKICKDLGMFAELWDPIWARDWQNEYAIHVFEVVKNRKTKQNEIVDKWRRIDTPPFPGETDIVYDSPNQDEWRKQMSAWRAAMDHQAELSKAEAARLKASKRNLGNARRDLEDAGGNPRAAHAREQRPNVIDVQPEPPRDEVKPEATQRDSRPHTPHGARTEDKPFLIGKCRIAVKKTRNNATMFEIEMMDGSTFHTFSDRIYNEMNQHWAARDRLLIQYETKKVGDKSFRMITEWQVKK